MSDKPSIDSIFCAAIELESPDERRALVEQACGEDVDLRHQVERLLHAHFHGRSILDAPVQPVATVDKPLREIAGNVIGPYKLIEQIGEGGMGTVWMAQQTEPVKRVVALKLIKAGMDSREVIARFEAERQALALMDHPNIARVLDAGTTAAGRPYFVMDLVKGVPITKYCDEHRLTPRQRLELFLPVCQAVQHAHQKGIIHRDLKPSNVLVALYDGKPVPKVIDFGVAKAAGQPLTEKTLVTGFGALVGTLEYMSPEQAEVNQLDIDTRSDIYSLGVLLYELLAGSPPFTRKELEKAGMLEMLRVIREQEPTKPSAKLSTAEGLPTLAANRGTEPAKLTRLVRGELDWIVMKALEKDRSRRYETANGFAMDVQRYLADEPVLACPPSAGYRLRKFARRHKVGLAVAALVLVFLVLLGTAIGWAVRDRSAREAETARQRAARQAKVAGQVESILAEVDRLEEKQKWPEALAAARPAGAAVAGGEADAATAEQVRERLKDLEFIDRLEQIRTTSETDETDFADVRERDLDQEYARAFRDYGVDVDELAVEASIQRLRTRPALAIALAAKLDQWVGLRHIKGHYKGDDAGWKRLVAIAHGIDPEPLRDRLRSIHSPVSQETPVSPETQEELRRLADSINVRAQHPATLIRLADTLYANGLRDSSIRILRDAQAVYPGDYWINSQLGHQLLHSRTRQDVDGAIRYLTAAVAVRPSTAGFYASELAQYLRAIGDLDQAIAVSRRAIDARPEQAGYYWHFIGGILREQQKPAEAADADRRAVAAHWQAVEARPDRAFYHIAGIGKILRSQGKPDEEIALYRQAIETRPHDARLSWHALGDALRAQGKPDEAVEAYRQTIAAYSQALEATAKADNARWRIIRFCRTTGDTLIAQGKPDEAVEAYRQAIAAYRWDFDRERDPPFPRRSADPVLDLGRTLIAQGKSDEAVAIYKLAVEALPERADSYFHAIGDIRRDQKKPAEAVGAYRKAIELKPDVPRHHHNLGLALRDQNRPAEANAAFDRAIELFRQAPNLTPGTQRYWNVGLVLRDKGDLDGAIAAFRKVRDIGPSSDLAIRELANALRARGRMDEALDVYRKAIQADPTDYTYYFDFGAALEQQNKLDEAVVVYRQAAEHAPRTGNAAAAAYHNIGLVLQRQGKRPEAIAAYYRTIELDPDNLAAGAYVNLGNVLRDWGKLDEAIAAYRKAIDVNQPYALLAAHVCLGDALSQQDKLDEAIDVYRTIIKLQPNSPVTHSKIAWILATRPEAHLRDPKQALALARRAVEIGPTTSLAWQFMGWIHYRTGDWKASIEALEKSCTLQEGGTGDAAQWIVLALAHARLAAQEGLPEKVREHHKAEARRWFDQADKQIDSWWPGDTIGRGIWDFRAEARELMGAKENKKE
jgi:tetratricopeptide (TPR) repeat protein/serine/threonine protein kinase